MTTAQIIQELIKMRDEHKVYVQWCNDNKVGKTLDEAALYDAKRDATLTSIEMLNNLLANA